MESLSELLEKAAEAVRRDLKHIFIEVSSAKLSASSARDLVAYTKLLADLAEGQQEAAEQAANEIVRNEANARADSSSGSKA